METTHMPNPAEEQYNRTIAHLNMNEEVCANCEECGARIPVELTLCDACQD
jgi:hypothetical protein